MGPPPLPEVRNRALILRRTAPESDPTAKTTSGKEPPGTLLALTPASREIPLPAATGTDRNWRAGREVRALKGPGTAQVITLHEVNPELAQHFQRL